jgi:RimJ/RimL family protein N-acetyltransferase
METTRAEPHVIASGSKVILRDRIPSEVDRWIYWQTHGEWRTTDAPWESLPEALTPEDEAKLREGFLRFCGKDLPTPRSLAAIAAPDGRPLGWVSRYSPEGTPEEWYVGINICEDDYLNQGIGTEALWLWVDYLFANSDVHRIALHTWSLNPRMMRVAKKVGFSREGVVRELREWQGEWLDGVQYGMLRREWQEKKGEDS